MLTMPCPTCGRPLRITPSPAERRDRCPHCRGLLKPLAVNAEAEAGPTVRMRALQADVRGAEPAARSVRSDEQPRVAPLAYVAMLAAVPVILLPLLFPLPALLGILALRSIARNPGYVGEEWAVLGIVWGVLGAVLTCFWAVVLLFN